VNPFLLAGGIYKAKDNETPRMISRMFGCDLDRFVQMNRRDHPTLFANAKFKEGTVVRIPRPGDRCDFVPAERLPHAPEGWSAYCHWTFPDQKVEDLFPSYMMVRRLERKSRNELPQNSSLLNIEPRRSKLPPPAKSIKELEEEDNGDAERKRKTSLLLPDDWPSGGIYVCLEDDRCVDIAKRCAYFALNPRSTVGGKDTIG
jgi:hypothetical protein